ncbi:MAG TPA: hypothetical protein VJ183_04305 [Chloroflexia bacterium]|nr:hypothetical protein [Chloroflexia bacterium]
MYKFRISVQGLIVVILTMLIQVSTGYHATPASAQAQSGTRFFAETGRTVKGQFLAYWEEHGGLMQQGYPIGEEMQEVSEIDGKTYTMQYFERAVFERHPENQPPYDVLLTQLGVIEYARRYGETIAPGQKASTDNPITFKETGKTLGGKFRQYWETHGDVMQQGYPFTEEFQERSPVDGKVYTVQYFERAVFELHPENAGTPYEVLLSHLGTFHYRARHETLVIPAPAKGRMQLLPKGSDSYLIWLEATPNTGDGNYDILGVDLKSNTPITVTGAPGNQDFASVSGSTVLWVDNGHSCPSCDYDILGKDLATGREFTVATGPNDQTKPAIAGKKVAWVEMSRDAIRLLLKDLDSGELYEVQSFPMQNGSSYGPTFGYTAISEEYLVWSERPPSTKNSGQLFELRAMSLKTREVRSVYKGILGISGASDEPSLSGHRLVYSTPQIQMVDLDTGETRKLLDAPSYSARIKGDVVAWISQSRIWGMRLSDPDHLAIQLVDQPVSQGDWTTTVAIAGDWLVWNNAVGPNMDMMSAKRLSEAIGTGPSSLTP